MAKSDRKRITLIALCIVGIAILVLAQVFMSGGQANVANSSTNNDKQSVYLPQNGDAFRPLKDPNPNQYSSVKSKTKLKDKYNRRAYSGAPPVVPHPVEKIGKVPFESCNQCHEKGGFAPSLNKWAPVTPHPEYSNCRQCHVSKLTNKTFKPTSFKGIQPPKLNQRGLFSSPPKIPHTLQLRGNCSACHSGPAAPMEIRTSHPERTNCRQCHVPVTTPKRFFK